MPRLGYQPRVIVAFVLALLVAAVVASVSAGNAAASAKSGITLDAPKTVTVVDGSVVIPFSLTNSTESAATCTVLPTGPSGGQVAPPQTITIAPGATSESSFTFSYNGERRVTIFLTCDGQLVNNEKTRVSIIA